MSLRNTGARCGIAAALVFSAHAATGAVAHGAESASEGSRAADAAADIASALSEPVAFVGVKAGEASPGDIGAALTEPVALASHRRWSPACPPAPCPPSPCPATPCPADDIAPSLSEPAEAPTPAPANGPTPAPAPSVDEPAADEPQVAPVPSAAADVDFGNFSQPSGGALFANRSPVAGATAPGYIDDARIRTRVRVRYDNATGADEPSRAQYFYPQFGPLFLPTIGVGPANLPDLVDTEEVQTYIEVAPRNDFSLFVMLPYRKVSGPNDLAFELGDPDGFSDIQAGFRYGLITCPDEALTLQVRAYAPTGEEFEGLGTGHASIEVGMLYTANLDSRWTFFAEIQDWQSIDTDELQVNDPTFTNIVDVDTTGNVLRYGVGLGYDLFKGCSCRCGQKRLTAFYEIVGWTVLDGITTTYDYNTLSVLTTDDIEDATGDTIINGKYGLRYNWKKESVYVGYGHNYTGDRWYSDLLRVEWTHNF